jgi:hypothetical protein
MMTSNLLAVAAAAAVVLSFITAVIGLLNQRKIKDTAVKVQEVHVLVNSQLSAVVARVTQLVGTLEHAGVAVPPNQNGGQVPPAVGP